MLSVLEESSTVDKYYIILFNNNIKMISGIMQLEQVLDEATALSKK
jgi:hypothetical protein